MEELALTTRFVDKFVKGFVLNLIEKASDILLVIGTLFYQRYHGRLSIQAWKDNVWEAATPWIWLLCALAAYHVIKAARSLTRELRQGLYQSKKPFIIITDGEPTRLTPNYQFKIFGMVLVLILLFSAVSYLSWLSARKTTNADTFNISVDATFIDMNQNLAFAAWWTTYKSPIGDTTSPIALVQFVDITNLLPVPETIKTYSVAIHSEDCGWTYLHPIYLQNVSVWFGGSGLQNAYQVDFKSNGLDYSLQKAIPAYETISGWWFFETTKKCDASPGTKIRYRFSLSTFNDIRFEYTTTEITVRKEAEFGSFEGHTKGPQLVVPPNAKRDISNLYRSLGGASGGYRVRPN